MKKMKKDLLFHEYFEDWLELYKVGAIREITLNKYYMTLQKVTELAPTLKLSEIDRRSYQKLLNEYALTHEKQTTMDFHHQIKGAILDAVDEGLIKKIQHGKLLSKGKSQKRRKKIFESIRIAVLIKTIRSKR